jgi:hypothetical protein
MERDTLDQQPRQIHAHALIGYEWHSSTPECDALLDFAQSGHDKLVAPGYVVLWAGPVCALINVGQAFLRLSIARA